MENIEKGLENIIKYTSLIEGKLAPYEIPFNRASTIALSLQGIRKEVLEMRLALMEKGLIEEGEEE